MTTPPSRRPPTEPAKPRPPYGSRRAGAGLAAPRPEGEGAPQSIPAAAAAEALMQPGAAASAGRGQGEAAGQGTAELEFAGTGTGTGGRTGIGAGAASGAGLGQRAGVGRAEGETATLGRGQGQSRAQGLGQGQARGAVKAVAAEPRGIGRRDREPEAEPESEPQAAPAIPTKPVLSRPMVALFGIRAGQLVAWELAILAVALVYRERLNILIPVAAGAVVIIALTVIRRRGRWLYQWLGLWLRYQTRHRRRRITGGEDAESDEVARTLLAGVVRGAEIVPIEIDETEVALISHAGGLTAVLEVTPADAGHVVEPSQVLPPLPALLPSGEIGEPVVSVQVVIQSIPAPNFLGLADSAAISYRELATGVVPATRGCWLALQAQHVAEDYTAKDLQESVIRAVERLQRRLRKSGLRARLLNRDEVTTELLSLARVDSGDVTSSAPSQREKPARPAVQEAWRTWFAGPQVHTTFRLLDWPDLADPTGRELLDRLVRAPTLATTVTVAARRRAATEEIELEAAVRVTLPGGTAVESATKEIQGIVELAGGRIERLDGEHVFGVAATLPLGGFLS